MSIRIKMEFRGDKNNRSLFQPYASRAVSRGEEIAGVVVRCFVNQFSDTRRRILIMPWYLPPDLGIWALKGYTTDRLAGPWCHRCHRCSTLLRVPCVNVMFDAGSLTVEVWDDRFPRTSNGDTGRPGSACSDLAFLLDRSRRTQP